MIQVVENINDRPFTQRIDEITATHDQSNLHVHAKDQEGYLEADELKNYLDNKPEIYICGGTRFLHSIIEEIKSLNYDMERVHYETFIPRLSFQV